MKRTKTYIDMLQDMRNDTENNFLMRCNEVQISVANTFIVVPYSEF